MKRFARWMVMVLLGCFCVAAVAQEHKPPSKPVVGQQQTEKAAAQGGPPVPRPGPEMRKLMQTFLGVWSIAEEHPASEMMPAGRSSGTSRFHRGPGALSVVENVQATGTSGRFAGLGIVSWDPKLKAYKSYWCDSMTPSGCEPGGTGNWEGVNLVFSGEMDTGQGQKAAMKTVYTDIKPDSLTMNMEMNGKPVMTIKYTRQAGKPAEAAPKQ